MKKEILRNKNKYLANQIFKERY